MFPTKAIRIVSLAPDISSSTSGRDLESDSPTSKARSGPGQPTDQMWQSQAALLQLVSLLSDDPAEWEDNEAAEDDDDTEGET